MKKWLMLVLDLMFACCCLPGGCLSIDTNKTSLAKIDQESVETPAQIEVDQ